MGQSAPGAGYGGNVLGVGMVSGTLDGKPCAPLLPARKEWTHRSRAVSTAWSTGYLQCYDDHVAAVRFTPRGVKMTDAELFWLVRADAKPKDYNIAKMKDLWELVAAYKNVKSIFLKNSFDHVIIALVFFGHALFPLTSF